LSQAAPVRIRTATEDDAAAIAEVHVASWRGAYRGVVPDQVLDGADLLGGRRRMWQRLLGDAAPAGHAAWVAEADGQVVAFADVLPSRDDDADERTAEVPMIYALPQAWGTGAGRELMAAALAGARAAGYRSVTLWVLDTNERARRFYERAGFAPDGTEKTDTTAGATLTEVRYRRDLSAGPTSPATICADSVTSGSPPPGCAEPPTR
jgi:GNAT superfamily N-acetyltransferase